MDLLVGAQFLGAKYGVPAMETSGPPDTFEIPEWKGAGRRHGDPPKMEVGRIVNISSVHGLLQAPRALIYEAGKAAVVGLTRQMAVDFGPLGITVNAIAPGHIVTERGEAMWAELGNDAGFRTIRTPLPRKAHRRACRHRECYRLPMFTGCFVHNWRRVASGRRYVDPAAREHRDAHEGLHRGEPGPANAFRSRSFGLAPVSHNRYFVADVDGAGVLCFE